MLQLNNYFTGGTAMAVRSIKLKLKTRTGPEAEQLRKGIWRTHRLINEGIAYYMNWLVLMRQEPIGDRPKTDIQLELMSKICEQQKKNNWSGEVKEEEILTLLRQLYELIVPSSTGMGGDAQMLSRKFLSPLTDPESQGGKGTSKAGRKPGWLTKKEAGDPTWEEDKKKADARKQADPTAIVLDGLEAFGLKPLMPLFTDEQHDIQWLPKSKKQFVRTWDRDMFQQAIEKMLSWESWNIRVTDERRKLEEKITHFEATHLSGDTDWVKGLEYYQQNRQIELVNESFTPIDDYKITPRQVRGWDRVYEKWSKLDSSTTSEELWKLVVKTQKSMNRGFGDPKLFKFLTEPDNRYIWTGHPERLYHFAAYNNLLKKLSEAKEMATFTLPDAIKHPLWIRYDARGGNIHSYTLQQRDPKHLSVILDKMLWTGNDGQWTERENVEIPIAPSKQLNHNFKLFDNSDGKQKIEYRDYSSGISLKGTLGGSKIQFDRKYLEKSIKKITNGNIGSVFFNLVMDLEPLQEIKNGRLKTPIGQALEIKTLGLEWPKVTNYKSEELVQWLQITPETNALGVKSIATGMRIMSIDMGQRTAAAVSIFEVVKEKEENNQSKLYYKISDTGLYALHRRSLLLSLPGEEATREAREKRTRRKKAYYSIRKQVRLLSDILRLHTKDTPEEREKAIARITSSIYQVDTIQDKEIWLNEMEYLKSLTYHQQEEWKQSVISSHHRLEFNVGKAVSMWRKSLSEGRQNLFGLSLLNIEELEETRKLLVSWSKRARTPEEVRRIDRNEKFGQNLLDHIQNVKDDRLKQMANLIVMTALGYKYDEHQKCWKEAYPACQVILFEDLGRYLFKMDRPRSENSKLMKWAHRSIPKMVYMQGELYGIQVGDVRSEFSSRFHAKTGAPGIRCHSLTEDDLKSGSSLIKELIEAKFLTDDKVPLLKPGDIVPRQGGELFVTLGSHWNRGKNKLAVIHADINAAQNLQKRFWQQNSEIFRIPCRLVKTKDGEFYIPKYQSKLIQKYLGNGKFIEIQGQPNVYKWENSSKIKVKTDFSLETANLADLENLDGLEYFEQALEEAQEVRGGYQTLFRDPSGYFYHNKDTWHPQKDFWSKVTSIIEKQLREIIIARENIG